MSVETLHFVAELMRADAASPVALAVADLLDLTAGHEERAGDECGQGYSSGGGYGFIDPSCSVCGTPDEYAEPWPCVYAARGLAVARAYLEEQQP